MNNRDVYAKVTANLIAAMERGVIPWSKGYTQGIQRNAVSLHPYSGVNVWVTMLEAQERGYTTTGWVTFKQALSLGLVVRKGEHGTSIIFMSKVAPKTKRGDEPRDPYFLAKAYSVFNLDQLTELDGNAGALQAARERVMPSRVHETMADLDAVVAATGATVRFDASTIPCYSPDADEIRMPFATQYAEGQTYYATLFHELGHWTGHPSRLARTFGARFGDHAYAAEELVAELTAAYLATRYGLEVVSRAAAYLDHWIKALRSDPSILVGAASAASKAAEFIAPSVAVATEEDAEEEVAA